MGSSRAEVTVDDADQRGAQSRPPGSGVSKPVASACSCVKVTRFNVAQWMALLSSTKLRDATNSPLLAGFAPTRDQRRPFAS